MTYSKLSWLPLGPEGWVPPELSPDRSRLRYCLRLVPLSSSACFPHFTPRILPRSVFPRTASMPLQRPPALLLLISQLAGRPSQPASLFTSDQRCHLKKSFSPPFLHNEGWALVISSLSAQLFTSFCFRNSHFLLSQFSLVPRFSVSSFKVPMWPFRFYFVIF